MSLLTFIVIIVGMGCITSIIQTRYRTRHGIIEDAMGNQTLIRQADDSEKSALREELHELRERVKVLERIATDERARLGLADEIERLRGS
jgi:hypothetical protein